MNDTTNTIEAPEGLDPDTQHELDVLLTIIEALEPLDRSTQQRIVAYVADRFQPTSRSVTRHR